jgi:enamine deaminase RidA (YjgF/YER057c/UK114 family)
VCPRARDQDLTILPGGLSGHDPPASARSGVKAMANFDVINPGWQAFDRYTFSPAVRRGNFVFVSGMTATDDEGNVVGTDLATQTRHILTKLRHVLAEAGATLDDVMMTTDYITTTDGYRETAAVRREFWTSGFPAATGIIVKGLLREGALIEIDAVAMIGR